MRFGGFGANGFGFGPLSLIRAVGAVTGLGPELVIGGTFDNPSQWVLSGTPGDGRPTIANGVLTFSGGSGETASGISQAAVTIVPNAIYRVQFSFIKQGGNFNVGVPGGNIQATDSIEYVGDHSSVGSSFQPFITDNLFGSGGVFDNYSVRRVL